MGKSPNSAAAGQETTRDRVLWQIGHCLRQGCVICIQHTQQLSPRFTKWELWGTPDCYSGNPDQLYGEIDRCRQCHADHYIRLDIEDYQVHSRFSFVVHQPDDRV